MRKAERVDGLRRFSTVIEGGVSCACERQLKFAMISCLCFRVNIYYESQYYSVYVSRVNHMILLAGSDA